MQNLLITLIWHHHRGLMFARQWTDRKILRWVLRDDVVVGMSIEAGHSKHRRRLPSSALPIPALRTLVVDLTFAASFSRAVSCIMFRDFSVLRARSLPPRRFSIMRVVASLSHSSYFIRGARKVTSTVPIRFTVTIRARTPSVVFMIGRNPDSSWREKTAGNLYSFRYASFKLSLLLKKLALAEKIQRRINRRMHYK